MLLRTSLAALAVFGAAVATAFTFSGAAFAQENFTREPDALQFPFEAQPQSTNRFFNMSDVRISIERSVDLILCETLMRRDGEWPPPGPPPHPPFESDDCKPAYAQRVAANEGRVHWASGARPTQCGQSCFGRPTMTAQNQRTRPNLRQAHIKAWVNLRAGPSGAQRDVSYPLDIFLTCNAQNGALDGVLIAEAKAGPPAIGDPGVLESIGNYLTLGYLSSRIESEIKSSVGPRRETLQPCRSVGVLLDADPVADAIRYDPPLANAPPRVTETGAAGALRDRVRIEFLRIVRNPLPPTVPEVHGSAGRPESGQFTVFLNGASHFLPPQGLVLPVSGGAAPINVCTTVDVTDWNRLQILFTNDLGGAVWSQFTRAQGFGGRTIRKLTTQRNIGVIRLHEAAVVLNEFELTYRITFLPRPGIAQPTPARPRRPGIAGSVLGTGTGVAIDSSAPPQTPCRQI